MFGLGLATKQLNSDATGVRNGSTSRSPQLRIIELTVTNSPPPYRHRIACPLSHYPIMPFTHPPLHAFAKHRHITPPRGKLHIIERIPDKGLTKAELRYL
jgi:hypothetical protein